MVEKTEEMELICVVKPQALIVKNLSSAWRMLEDDKVSDERNITYGLPIPARKLCCRPIIL